MPVPRTLPGARAGAESPGKRIANITDRARSAAWHAPLMCRPRGARPAHTHARRVPTRTRGSRPSCRAPHARRLARPPTHRERRRGAAATSRHPAHFLPFFRLGVLWRLRRRRVRGHQRARLRRGRRVLLIERLTRLARARHLPSARVHLPTANTTSATAHVWEVGIRRTRRFVRRARARCAAWATT